MPLYQLFQGWCRGRLHAHLLRIKYNTISRNRNAQWQWCNGHTSPEEDKIEQQSRMETESADLETFQAQNRRLLPNFKNPLHVIDGPEQRYFIGIIDIFTVYGFKKRLEYLWKRLRHPRKTFSTVSPPAYCHRLCQWVQDHTK